MPNDFVSSQNFNIIDEIIRRNRGTSFGSLGRQKLSESELRSTIEASLSAGAQQASDRERISNEFELREEQNQIQRDNLDRLNKQQAFDEAFREEQTAFENSFNERQLKFRKDEADNTRTSALFGGLAKGAATVAGFGILKYFKII